MEILTSGNGYKHVLAHLKKKGYQWKAIMPINMGRYHIIIGNYENKEPHNILIIFKREIFYSFGTIKELVKQGATGVGESINLEQLKTAMGYDVKSIFICYESGAIYSIEFWDYMKKCYKYTNKEGKEVRSISLKELKRVNPVE